MHSSRRLHILPGILCVALSLVCFSSAPAQSTDLPSDTKTAVIPGPLRAFLRMAGISQRIPQDQVLPLLAHNVFVQGYSGAQKKGRPTEFLILLTRYVRQARELSAMAGPDGVIRIPDCQHLDPLLRVLGYRLRQNCGQKDASLITSDPERAFLTIDSGFPLNDLEEMVQGGRPFSYTFAPSRVPVLFSESDWAAVKRTDGLASGDLLDALLSDPWLARLYWAMSRTDLETANALRQQPGLGRFVPLAAVFDFYGSQICIRSGHVVVPGGPKAESQWKSLVGASPSSPDEFVPRLLAKDRGWLGAYFDALSRVSQEQQSHFVEGQRLRRFYDAFRSPDPSEDPARPTFRPAAALLLLVTRLQWQQNGDPLIPGGLQVWPQILRQKSDSKLVHDWAKRANQWNAPDQLVEAMFAFSRLTTNSGPLHAYLALSEIDSHRAPEKRLSPQTVMLLSSKFTQLSDQYRIFSEFSDLNDVSITHFVNVAEDLTRISHHALRGDAMGIFQANVGLWQILARQGQIAKEDWNGSWQRVISPFDALASPHQLYGAAHASLAELLHAAGGNVSMSQYAVVDLLAGPSQTNIEGQRIHDETAARIRAILEDQRLVPLDTLLALGDALNRIAQNHVADDTFATLAGQLREFEMPRPIFTGSERTQWASGVYNNRHTDLEMRTDLVKTIKTARSATELQEARGQLTPFLRDTLVGLNYAYYEPPGAQILHYNPLFVRSHDFSGDTVTGVEQVWQAPRLFGEGSPAGGGARLVGSLADLPYVLGVLEQDFIAPENVQALIWRELVPGLLINATLPRWWGVSNHELHAVALYQKSGEEFLAAAARNEERHQQVMVILSDRMAPQSLEALNEALKAGHLESALPQLTPADTFYLAAEFRRRFPRASNDGPATTELSDLYSRYPGDLRWDRLSQDFGVPHPILSHRYSSELLNLKPLPALSGYSSRLLAESWDSNNLYWARLADEMGYAPVTLNRLVPQLTHRMIEKIFATDQEDWQAILRAMRETGDEFKQGKFAPPAQSSASIQP